MVNPFELKTVLLAKGTTCRTDPFSDRAIHFSSGVRLYGAVDETTGPGGRPITTCLQ
jgi:hypothetical protein